MGAARDLARVLLAVALMVGSPACTAVAAEAPGSNDGLVGKTSIPLKTVTFSGHRYVAPADLGLPSAVPFMVHGNARLRVMLTHETAARVSGHPVEKREAYGYSRRGKGAIDVALLRLGGQRFENLTNVPVFDFTEEPDTTVGGMLGVRFLVESNAAVDFSRDRLLLGVARSSAPNPTLLERGYHHQPFDISAQGRTTIPVYFPALRRTIPITPSTVSNALTLHHPLFVGRVRLRRAPLPDRSPHGTTPDEYIADRVEFQIAGVSCAESGVFEDLAEYANVPEGELESDGMLGFDWMKRHRAILDYANRTLYFLP